MAQKQAQPAHRHIEPEWGSVPDVSRVTGLGRTKVYDLINDGTIETKKIGKRRLCRLSSARSLNGPDA